MWYWEWVAQVQQRWSSRERKGQCLCCKMLHAWVSKKERMISGIVFEELEGRIYLGHEAIKEMRKIIICCIYWISKFTLVPVNCSSPVCSFFFFLSLTGQEKRERERTAHKVKLILFLYVWFYSFPLQLSQPLLTFCFWSTHVRL